MSAVTIDHEGPSDELVVTVVDHLGAEIDVFATLDALDELLDNVVDTVAALAVALETATAGNASRQTATARDLPPGNR